MDGWSCPVEMYDKFHLAQTNKHLANNLYDCQTPSMGKEISSGIGLVGDSGYLFTLSQR